MSSINAVSSSSLTGIALSASDAPTSTRAPRRNSGERRACIAAILCTDTMSRRESFTTDLPGLRYPSGASPGLCVGSFPSSAASSFSTGFGDGSDGRDGGDTLAVAGTVEPRCVSSSPLLVRFGGWHAAHPSLAHSHGVSDLDSRTSLPCPPGLTAPRHCSAVSGRRYSNLKEFFSVRLSLSTFAGPPKAMMSPFRRGQGPSGMRFPFKYVPLSVFLSVTECSPSASHTISAC